MDKKQEKPLDLDLFEKFKKLYFDDYEYLAPDTSSKENNKIDFLAGRINNPTFIYTLLDKFDFDEKESGFEKLKKDANNNKNPVVREAYTARIDEMISQIKMLKAANEGNDDEFTTNSESVYGKPSMEIFEYDLATITKTIEKAYASDDKKSIKSAKQLKNIFGNLLIDNSINEKYKMLPVPVDDKSKPLNASEIKSMFERALIEFGISNWIVVIDETGEKVNLSANQETKTVNIPNDDHLKNRAKKTIKINIKALIAHELGTHALRRENGENSKLKLLGLGLDRFLKGEEGLASYEYQQIEGASDFAAFLSHFSLSLAKGLDGTKRNFREVFEILKLYLLVSIGSRDQKDAEKKAEIIAWNTCVRCFRGTTCKTPGAVFTKGHIYRAGNIEIYELVSKKSKEVKRFMSGKYDPANPQHAKILNKLGIY